VHTLLKGLEKIAASADIPMVVAGDFNSLPGSAPHALLVNGRVDRAQLDATPDPLGILKDQRLSHQLPLASAYTTLMDAAGPDPRLAKQRLRLDGRHREPLFTNLTRDFKGTLDYVLYTRDSLAPTALLELPTEAELTSRPEEALPNANWSSDHVALMVELAYR
jgi:CCR4-NOT transcription complex subunit 6